MEQRWGVNVVELSSEGVNRNRTEACRDRIEKAMREEGEGNRAQQADDRTNKKLWKEMERLQKEQEQEAKRAKKEEEQKEKAEEDQDRKRKDEDEGEDRKRHRGYEPEELARKRQSPEEEQGIGPAGAKEKRTDGRHPSSQKRKAEDMPEDDRKPKACRGLKNHRIWRMTRARTSQPGVAWTSTTYGK